MLHRIRKVLLEPRLRALDVDGADFSVTHRRILIEKPMLQHDALLRGPGLRVEIGSGSGFMGQEYPDVITSDIKVLPFVQVVCRGECLPVRDGSVRCVYAINTFHHLPAPSRFFTELQRVLSPGGGAILIEPYHGALARALFRRLHASEGFDEHAAWDADPDAGPFSSANQALSYIVFNRDRERFEREFPALRLVADEPHTNLRYLLSGGVNFRQLIPNAASPVVAAIERVLRPLNPVLALQHTLVLRRTDAA
jgi:SAM-dependent methyltransferase